MKSYRQLAAASLLLISYTGSTWAQEDALRRCRGISDSAARLRCYDALPLVAPPAAAMPPSAAPSPAAAPQAPGAPTTAASAPTERFGLEYKEARPADDLARLETYIPGRFEGWRPRDKITLANGQVWQVIDETSRVMAVDNPKVVLRRGIFGAFFLDFEGDNRSPRVRRVE